MVAQANPAIDMILGRSLRLESAISHGSAGILPAMDMILGRSLRVVLTTTRTKIISIKFKQSTYQSKGTSNDQKTLTGATIAKSGKKL
jgi:hypothetical protein